MFEVRMPKLGQTVEEAMITEWLKKEGDFVKEGEPLFKVQTDKAEIDFESPVSGFLLKILVKEGIEVPVLTVVAIIGEQGEVIPETYTSQSPSSEKPVSVGEQVVQESITTGARGDNKQEVMEKVEFVQTGEVKASPRAKTTAGRLGIPLGDVVGTGVGGRIMAKDVEQFAQQSPKATPTAKRIAEQQGIDLSRVEGTGPQSKITKADVEGLKQVQQKPQEVTVPSGLPTQPVRIPLTPMRKIIAERMSHSLKVAPHYYVTVEIDMTNAKLLRERLPFKVSFNDIVLYATVRTIREFPQVNVQWGEDCLIQMPDINLGVAVALPQGLIVPVIKKAQELSLEGISKKAKELITKAQNNKLLPDDYTGNTFTVSNLGPYGVDHFTAIINQPDSAILAVGQIKDRPVVLNGGIHIRPIMKVTMSSDHRVIDGAVAGQFMGRFREILEQADFY